MFFMFFFRCILCIWNSKIGVLCSAVYDKMNSCYISIDFMFVKLSWRFDIVEKFLQC